MKTKDGKETFVAHVIKHRLPTLASSIDTFPADLPNLESIDFHHQAIVFTKKMNRQSHRMS